MVHSKGGFRSEIDEPSRAAAEANKRGRERNDRLADQAEFTGINWHRYEHYQLYDMIMSAHPAQMGHLAAKWSTLASAIKETTDGVDRAIKELLRTWRGAAAVSAGESTTRLARWAEDASHRAGRIGEGMVRYTEAVETAQHRMPPPEFASAEENFLHGFHVKGSGGPSTAILIRHLLDDQKPDFDKQRDAHAEAIRVMKEYSQESQTVHNTMLPELPTDPPPGPNTGTDVPPGPIGGGDDPIHTPPPPPRPVDPPTGAGDRDPGSTTAEGFTSTPGTGTGDGARGGYGSGFAAGPGGPGAGGADATRGPGGLSGAGSLAARGGAGLAGARGGAAGGGGFGPFGAGAGAQREEDKEHKNKFEEGLDLFDDLPPAYPSVFGA